MIQDIDKHIDIINESIDWAKKFKKDSFPFEQFKDCRRRLFKIRKALTGNCSAAAYGESQVGKSYLMSSLLSSPTQPFVIENEGHNYSFIDELNPSGGNNAKIESTGVITRFTIQRHDNSPKDLVRISTLSVVDIILLLTDSYYHDIKINPETVLPYDVINRELENISALCLNQVQHNIITEDDIKDINDYIKDIIGNSAAAIYQSNFCKMVSATIPYIPNSKWIDVFSLLWNKNPEINKLFITLIEAYQKLNFQQEVYVPFKAVLRKYGTLLKIEWLDTVCGIHNINDGEEIYTDVYDKCGQPIVSGFSKGELSALTAELTFELPQNIASERKFLQSMDLLDFPGARSREKYKEKEIASVLPKMLRRGKVAYLFNKYSRSLQIGSVLFCHHNDQKSEPTIGEAINNWLEENIGYTPEERAKMLRNTNGIAPLFLVATKFNIDLERTKTDNANNGETLDKHWNRFDTVLPEIIKPNKWLDEWMVSSNGTIEPFQNIYPLRDFYWSGKNGLFDGYSDGKKRSEETAVRIPVDFPDYWDRLKESFMQNRFVQLHFANPEATWNSVATLNHDGSKNIIKNLDSISGFLDNARKRKYIEELATLKKELLNTLQVFYEPEDIASKNKKVRLIAGDIRRALMQTVAKNPVAFGHILDSFMISSENLRNLAYDIVICHTATPKDFGAINFIRAGAGIDISDERQANINKLLAHYMLETENELNCYLKEQGFDIDDVVSKKIATLSRIEDVITQHIITAWIEHLHNTSQKLTNILPHAEEVVFMLVNLFEKLDVRKDISAQISRYVGLFNKNEQPNAIGDYAALTLNNFVCSVGREYMQDQTIDELKTKANACQIPIDFSPSGWNNTKKTQSLIDTLKVFDESSSIFDQGKIDMSVLRQLPFWNNYQRWENFVFVGLVYSSDISHCDPVCNKVIQELIERSSPLYSA